MTPDVASAVASALSSSADEHDAPAFVAVSLTVNGQSRSYDGDPMMPLLWFLRDELSLTGTKYGCGISQCGACTVHVNGTPTRACQRRMQTLSGASVTTSRAALTDLFHDQVPRLARIPVSLERSAAAAQLVEDGLSRLLLRNGQAVPELLRELDTLVGRQVTEV